MIKVLVVDDHQLFRQGMLLLLGRTEGIEVVGDAASLERAEELLYRLEPDVLVLDVSVGHENGLDFVEKLVFADNQTPVVVVTMSLDLGTFNRARRLPLVHAYVLKIDAFEELASAIRGAHSGRRFISPCVAAEMAWHTQEEFPEANLTPRERQVLTLVAEGLSSRQIASQVTLSRRTIDSHRAKIKAKTGLSNAADFARYAIAKKLV